MIPSELRKKAREALTGQWGKAALAMLLYTFVLAALNSVLQLCTAGTLLYALVYVGYMLLVIPLAYGFSIGFLKLKRKEDVESTYFLTSVFSNFSTAWNICIQVIVKMIVPIIGFFFICVLFVLLMVMKLYMTWLWAALWAVCCIAFLVYFVSIGLLYVLSNYISFDNENLSAKECVDKSEELMRGNRGNYFLLCLSFIGWFILGAFTCGIAYLWISPYLEVAVACFYDELIGSNAKAVEGTNKIEEDKEEDK